MVEYAVLISNSIGDRILGIYQDVFNFFGSRPVYWYVIAAAILFLIYLVLFRKS